MKIVSINIAEKCLIDWRGKKVPTGIFKLPAAQPVRILETGLEGDHVADKKFHGSRDMAVYAYSADHYTFWRKRYPVIDSFGFMGENLSISGLNETAFCFGDKLQIGDAILQITQPRQPCYKLGIRFGTQKIVGEFAKADFPGLYLRVLQEGIVRTGDAVVHVRIQNPGMKVLEFWGRVFDNNRSPSDVEKILNDPWLSTEAKDSLRRKIAQS